MKQPLAYIHPDAKIASTVVIDSYKGVDNNRGRNFSIRMNVS